MTEEHPSDLPATGERFLTENKDESVAEHLHRYSIAMNFCAGKQVLDIASGEGYGSNLLATSAQHVVGVDVSQEAINHASSKYARSNLKFIRGSASEIPLDSASIDIAISYETIEHHHEHEAMLRELRRVLRPNGLLVISTPEKLNYTDRRNVRNEYHVKELYLEEFRGLVARHFSNTSMLFQQIVYGSVVIPEDGANGFQFVQGDLSGFTRELSLPTPFYNICLASDAALPRLPISIFGASPEWSYAMQAKRERIAILEERTLNLSRTIQALESSTSFRIGRAITSPFRWIGGMNQRCDTKQ